MNTHESLPLYRVEQNSVEHIVLPAMSSDPDDIEVVDHEVEDIFLEAPDWDDAQPTIH